LAALPQFGNELKKLIEAEIERVREIVCRGDAIKDYADYQRHAGQLFSLNRVLNDYYPETESIINKREQ
jgi:hypothetical protein